MDWQGLSQGPSGSLAAKAEQNCRDGFRVNPYIWWPLYGFSGVLLMAALPSVCPKQALESTTKKEMRIMKRRFTTSALTALTMLVLISALCAGPSPVRAGGATPISGVGFFATVGQCTDSEGAGADYALTMTGDLSGCHYVFVEAAKCSPGGGYFEAGRETFVGTYNGQPGTFRTNYVFTAKYLDCPNLVGEVAGRCQHPIVDGSGTGIFEGVTGRFDIKDDVEVGNFPYRGHLLY